jgi:peroxiredoxin
MTSSTLTPRSSVITVGEVAPDFTLKTQDRADWTLSAELRKGDVVLCFYPLAFTGVCSTEMKCVSAEMGAWSAKGAQVVGISCDSFAANKAWADAEGLKQVLLCDMHREVCKAFGLYWGDLNVSQRGTVVIGKSADGKGVVKFVQARQPGNAMKWEEVLAQI